MIGGSLELPMCFIDGFLVTFMEGGWELSAHTLAHVQKYHTELTHAWISVTCGGRDPLMYRNTQTSHQSEILHSLIFTVRKQSCGKVMFLHLSVNLSTGEGVCPSVCWDTHPLGRHPPWADTSPGQTPPLGRHTPPGQTPLFRQTSPGQTPPGHPPWVDNPLGRQPRGQTPTQQTTTAADGTHTTGMHSCFISTVETGSALYCVRVVLRSCRNPW